MKEQPLTVHFLTRLVSSFLIDLKVTRYTSSLKGILKKIDYPKEISIKNLVYFTRAKCQIDFEHFLPIEAI
jgi:hypothetical protein